MNNAWTMLYLNVTNQHDDLTGAKAFSYVDSYVGKTCKLPNNQGGHPQNALGISTGFGNYLVQIDGSYGVSKNPFNVTRANFTDIGKL